MAPTKSVQNAAEASGRGSKATKAGRASKPKGDFEIPVDEQGWLSLADSLNIDTVAAKQLYNSMIPELQAAGYPNAQIKGILQAEDPHMAAKAFIADERAALSEALSKSNFGYKPEQIAALNLRDLKNTVDDAVGKKKERPSGIRGKDPNASTTVETKVPDEKQTASTKAELAPTPKEGAAKPGAEDAPKKTMSPFERYLAENPFSQDSTAAPQGSFQTEVIGPQGDFRATSTPGGGIRKPFMADVGPAAPKTESLAAITDAIQGIQPPKAARQKPAAKVPLRDQQLDGTRAQVEMSDVGEPADRGSGAIVVGRDFRPGQTVGVADAAPARGGAASPSVQPAPAPEVAAGAVDAVPPAAPKGPSIMETDPLLRAGSATAGGAGYVARNMWPTALATGAGLTALGYGLGLFGGGKQQPAAGPQPAGPGGMPAPQGGSRIIILPKDVLNQMEQRPMRQQPPMQPPPQPMPPQAAPPARPAGPGQTTDIIRALSGRMA